MTVRPEHMWGFKSVWVSADEQTNVSDLERTIIDCIDRPDLCGGLIEVARGIWAARGRIDYQRLAQYAKRMGRKSVAKRLGFLLDTFGLGAEGDLQILSDMVTASYASLDPTLPARGRYVSAWKIRANVDREELKTATET